MFLNRSLKIKQKVRRMTIAMSYNTECHQHSRNLITNSGGSRNFKTVSRGPCAVEFLGSGVCFDAPFTHTLCFVVRVENKVLTYFKHCMMAATTVYACYTVKCYKNEPPKYCKRGRAPGSAFD